MCFGESTRRKRWRALVLALFPAFAPPLLAADLTVQGPVVSREGGFVFPDGSVQLSATGPGAVSPRPVIGTVELDRDPGVVPAMDLRGIEFHVGPDPEGLDVSLSVDVDARSASPLVLQALLEQTPFALVTVTLDGVVFELQDAVAVFGHGQVTPRPPGAGMPQVTTLRFAPMGRLQVTAHPETGPSYVAGWDFPKKLSLGVPSGCYPDYVVYVVGDASPLVGKNVVPVGGYQVSVDRCEGTINECPPPVYRYMTLELADDHVAGVCLLGWLLSDEGPDELGALTTRSDGKQTVRDYWYRLFQPFPLPPGNEWGLDIRADGLGRLHYDAGLPFWDVCHGYYDDTLGEEEWCSTEPPAPPPWWWEIPK